MGPSEPSSIYVCGYSGVKSGTHVAVLRAPDESLLDLRERAWNVIGGNRLYTIYAEEHATRDTA